jgi:hypothetical protein
MKQTFAITDKMKAAEAISRLIGEIPIPTPIEWHNGAMLPFYLNIPCFLAQSSMWRWRTIL